MLNFRPTASYKPDSVSLKGRQPFILAVNCLAAPASYFVFWRTKSLLLLQIGFTTTNHYWLATAVATASRNTNWLFTFDDIIASIVSVALSLRLPHGKRDGRYPLSRHGAKRRGSPDFPLLSKLNSGCPLAVWSKIYYTATKLIVNCF